MFQIFGRSRHYARLIELVLSDFELGSAETLVSCHDSRTVLLLDSGSTPNISELNGIYGSSRRKFPRFRFVFSMYTPFCTISILMNKRNIPFRVRLQYITCVFFRRYANMAPDHRVLKALFETRPMSRHHGLNFARKIGNDRPGQTRFFFSSTNRR